MSARCIPIAVAVCILSSTAAAAAPINMTPSMRQIAAPANLWFTNDPTVCTSHSGALGALICPAMLAEGNILTLVWDWNAERCENGNCITSIDGFRIYKVTQAATSGRFAYLGTRTLVDTQSDPALTLRGIKPFGKTDCFVVVAYKGNQESDDSNTYCVTSQIALGVEEITKNPSREQTRSAFNVGCAHPNIYDSEYTISDFGTKSGTQAFQSSNCQGNENFQGLFAFDFTGTHKAKTAIMHIRPTNRTNCATKIAQTDNYWPGMNPANPETTHFQGVDANHEWDLSSPDNGEITLDVTLPYNTSWFNNKIGFAFIGPSARWGEFKPPSCITGYDIWVDVVQFK